MADDVFVEHCDVTAGGLEVEVAEQGGADVDGQAVVDQLGGEKAAEVVRAEVNPVEAGVGQRDGLAEVAEFFGDASGGRSPRCVGRCGVGRGTAAGRSRPGRCVEPCEHGNGCRRAVCRRMMQAMTWNSSADMGMTRSRSVLDGATTSSAMTSPLGRWYWRMLSWDSSVSSSIRNPLCRSV